MNKNPKSGKFLATVTCLHSAIIQPFRGNSSRTLVVAKVFLLFSTVYVAVHLLRNFIFPKSSKLCFSRLAWTQPSSSFVSTLPSNGFLVIASYANLYNRSHQLYIFPDKALSTESSSMTLIWNSASRNPAAKNLLLRICMNTISMWNILIINTLLLDFCFFFSFDFDCFGINDLVKNTNNLCQLQWFSNFQSSLYNLEMKKKCMYTIGGLYNDAYYIITMQFSNSKMMSCFVRKAGLLPKATKKMLDVGTKTNILDKWLTFWQPMSRCNQDNLCLFVEEGYHWW